MFAYKRYKFEIITILLLLIINNLRKKKILCHVLKTHGSFAAHCYFEMVSFLACHAKLFFFVLICIIFIRRRKLEIRHATDKYNQKIAIAKRVVLCAIRLEIHKWCLLHLFEEKKKNTKRTVFMR